MLTELVDLWDGAVQGDAKARAGVAGIPAIAGTVPQAAVAGPVGSRRDRRERMMISHSGRLPGHSLP
jgi:hypothetical protein